MEIDKHLHPCVSCPLSHGNSLCQVIGSTAVAISIRVIWIIPDSDSYPVHPLLCEEIEKFLIPYDISIKILVSPISPAKVLVSIHLVKGFLNRDIGRKVSATDGIGYSGFCFFCICFAAICV